MPAIVMTPAKNVSVGDVFSTDGSTVTEVGFVDAWNVTKVVVDLDGVEKVGWFESNKPLPLWK